MTQSSFPYKELQTNPYPGLPLTNKNKLEIIYSFLTAHESLRGTPPPQPAIRQQSVGSYLRDQHPEILAPAQSIKVMSDPQDILLPSSSPVTVATGPQQQ